MSRRLVRRAPRSSMSLHRHRRTRLPLAASWAGVLLVGALLPDGLSAQAGPPYQTDDPDPVEYRHWEFYLATQGVKADDVAAGTAPHIEVNYGASPGLQVHVLVPLAYAHPAGGPVAYGVGDVEVGVKLRLLTESRSRPMVGTFVQTEWPVGSAAEGLGTPELHVLIPLWLQKSVGPWSTDLGGGYWVDFDGVNGNYWCMGWQVQRRFSERATVGAEVYRTTAHGSAGGSFLSNVGLVLNLSDHDHLLVSAGRGLGGEPALQAYLAYQLTLGPGHPGR